MKYLNLAQICSHEILTYCLRTMSNTFRFETSSISNMASSNPSDEWVDVEDEEHLDVKELKSQIYDLKQKLALAHARETAALREKKEIQVELDHEKEKVTALEETNGKYKRELLLAKVDKRNDSLLEEEMEKSGKLRLELMQLKQAVKEKECMLETRQKNCNKPR